MDLSDIVKCEPYEVPVYDFWRKFDRISNVFTVEEKSKLQSLIGQRKVKNELMLKETINQISLIFGKITHQSIL